MTTLIAAVLSLSTFFMPAAPLLAQFSTTTATTTASTTPAQGSNSSGFGTLALVGLGVGAGLAIAGSLSSSFLFKSFGGRVTTVIPCASALGPSLWIAVIPSGLLPGPFIWTPGTLTYSAGPPRNPGQQVLGLADIPYVCFLPGKPPIPLPGLRMFSVGTSLI